MAPAASASGSLAISHAVAAGVEAGARRRQMTREQDQQRAGADSGQRQYAP
jgi:hypothetical protein